MKRAVKNLNLSRKKLFIITGIVVAIILVIYGGLSTWRWLQYKDTYTNWQRDVKSKLDLAIAMPTATTDEKAKWLSALDVVANTSEAPNLCTLSIVYRWQQSIVPSLRQEVTNCQTLQGKMDSLRSSLTMVVNTLHADESIATILSEPLKSTTVDETAYQAEIDAWSKAKAALNAVNAPNGAIAIKTAAISTAEAIRTAWSALMAANTAKNATQYQTALNELSGAYNGLNNVSNESKKALQIAADTVQKTYDDTF